MEYYFKLRKAKSFAWKGKKSGKLYSFKGDEVVPVSFGADTAHFRMDKETFFECDQRGTPIDPATGLQMTFTRKGMAPPRSYVKLSKAAPVAAPAPAPPAKPRTVISSKKVEAPAPPAQAAPELPKAPETEKVSADGDAAPDLAKEVSGADASKDEGASEPSGEKSESTASKKGRARKKRKKKSGRESSDK